LQAIGLSVGSCRLANVLQCAVVLSRWRVLFFCFHIKRKLSPERLCNLAAKDLRLGFVAGIPRLKDTLGQESSTFSRFNQD